MVLSSTGIGGAEIFALNVVRFINHDKYHIDFVVSSFAQGISIEAECRSYGCNFFQLPRFKIYNYAKYVESWDEFLRGHHYNIVYAHTTNSASIYLKIAKKYGMKTIAHSHSSGYRGNFLEQMVKKYFASKVGKYADYWFACSELAAERLYGNDYMKYHYYYNIPNAINTEKYLFNEDIRRKIRCKHHIDETTFVCGHVGSFTVPKNHKFLIDIFELVLKKNINSKLLCCGDGPTLQSIKDYAKIKGLLNYIVFAGVVNNVNEYMMAMDTFIFPSIFEGFPISILEAESTGLNIVMSDVISKDVDITELVHRCKLDQTASIWADKVLEISRHSRKEYNRYISDSKYNINYTIKDFEQLFVKLLH